MDYATYVSSGAERFDARLEELSERRCLGCTGEAAVLFGVLGRKAHLRCHGCGLQRSVDVFTGTCTTREAA